jgi:hypothetical protein
MVRVAPPILQDEAAKRKDSWVALHPSRVAPTPKNAERIEQGILGPTTKAIEKMGRTTSELEWRRVLDRRNLRLHTQINASITAHHRNTYNQRVYRSHAAAEIQAYLMETWYLK